MRNILYNILHESILQVVFIGINTVQMLPILNLKTTRS